MMTKVFNTNFKKYQHWFQATFVLGDFINALLFLIGMTLMAPFHFGQNIYMKYYRNFILYSLTFLIVNVNFLKGKVILKDADL